VVNEENHSATKLSARAARELVGELVGELVELGLVVELVGGSLGELVELLDRM